MAKQIRTLEERLHIIDEVEKNPFEKKINIAKRLDIPPSTLNSIISKKKEIREQASKYGTSAKKRKTSKMSTYSELERVLFDWYEQVRALNVSVDGSILRAKALEIAASNGMDTFSASNGWISRFKIRHGLASRKLSDESAAVVNSTDAIEMWFEKLPKLLEGYKDCDIYNADETGLFYECLPDRTLALKGESCYGGKHSKERLTVLLCTNKDGSDKRVPLVIGNTSRPRCFKNVKKLPVVYHSNANAWMKNDIFTKFLRDFDRSIGAQKRKIILFIDDCSAHSPDTLSLKNIKVIFFPANCTSVVQPLDAGIINCFKQFYRRKLVKRSLCFMEQANQPTPKMDVLQAIHFVLSAWHEVTSSAIQNCFVKCGYVRKNGEEWPTEGQENDDDDNADEEWLRVAEDVFGVKFSDYISIDQDLATCSILGIEEMCDDVKNENNSEEAEDNVHAEAEPTQVPSLSDAITAFETVRTFIYAHEITEKDQKNVVNVENLLFNLKNERKTQHKITDFLK